MYVICGIITIIHRVLTSSFDRRAPVGRFGSADPVGDVPGTVDYGFYIFSCRYEERILKEAFGDDYLKYKKKTGMLFPRLRSKQAIIP